MTRICHGCRRVFVGERRAELCAQCAEARTAGEPATETLAPTEGFVG